MESLAGKQLQLSTRTSLHLGIREQQLALLVQGRPASRNAWRTTTAVILSFFNSVDERPMDWVKPKHRARRLKASESGALEQDAAQRSASKWLEQLCEENVALLQSSLPMASPSSKPKGDPDSIQRYLNAMLWGTGDWEVAKPSNREFLHDLVEAFGSPWSLNPDGQPIKRGRRASKSLTPEIRSQQVAHATKIGKWITQQLPKSGFDPYVALTCAGWLHALPEVGRDVSPALWLDVLQSSLTQVDRAWESGNQEGLFPWVVWSCEIPLALVKQLSHLGGNDRMVSDTMNRIALMMEQCAEDPSSLLAFGGHDFRAVVASWIRSRWSATEVGARKWYPPQRKALAKLATQMLHLTDGLGKSLLTDAETTRHDPELWSSLFDLCGDSKKLLLAASVSLPDEIGLGLGNKPARMRKDKCLDASLPKASVYLEASRIACMRRSWRDRGCRVAVDFSSDVIWLDIAGEDGERVFSGDWDIHVTRDGKPVAIDVAWEEVCWFSDDDVDYLELECDLEGTCKIQRQLLLLRDEGMVLMADAIVSDTAAPWDVRSVWTLDPRIAFHPESKSNEGWLKRSDATSSPAEAKNVALVLPIGMPEWRRGTKQASLAFESGVLSLQTTSQQSRLYSPMVVALRGLKKEPKYTWRHLTVAQDLAIAPKEVAQGYRWQVGRDQWVLYRSLAPCKRRTMMGLHLHTEFYAGRFSNDDGSFEALVEVNPA